MDETMTLERLGEILNRLLNEGISVRFVKPSDDETPPSWQEIYEMILDAYLTALQDVRDSLGGDTSALEEFLSEEGRFFDLLARRNSDHNGGANGH